MEPKERREKQLFKELFKVADQLRVGRLRFLKLIIDLCIQSDDCVDIISALNGHTEKDFFEENLLRNEFYSIIHKVKPGKIDGAELEALTKLRERCTNSLTSLELENRKF